MDYFDIRPQKFYLLSTHNRRLLEYASHDHSLEHAVENAFSRIKCIEGGNVCAIYQFDANTLQVMTELSDMYKGQYKNIQQLPSYFKGFKEGDYFIRHQAWAPMFDLKRSMVKIDALANGRDPRRDDDIFVQNWGKLYLTYETYSYGFLTDKIKVGEDEADKRVCRFCGRTGKEFFKNESHAIQEALGNRLLICNEECDVCNSELSESVEKHLYKFMEINRTLSNISGKGSKNHHLEGLNFHIHPDPATLAPIVYIKQEHIINDSYQGKPTGKIHLYNNGQISYQGIY